MSDANRTSVRIVEEAVFGTTPATPVLEELRVTASSLSFSPQTVVSNELRADRQITDLIRVGFETGGDLPVEMSYGNPDRLIEGAMFSDWALTAVRDNSLDAAAISDVDEDTGDVTITVAAAAAGEARVGAFAAGMLVRTSGFDDANNNALNVLTAGDGTSLVYTGAGTDDATPAATARVKMVGIRALANGDLSAVTAGGNHILSDGAIDFTDFPELVPGAWLKISGFAGVAANNGWARIASAPTATQLFFDIVPVGFAADAAAAAIVTLWIGDYIRNSTTKKSYTIELQYQDLVVPEYEYYKGMRVSTMSLAGEAQAILTGSFSFMGASVVNDTAEFAGAVNKAAPTNEIMNTSDNVGALFENGQQVAAPNSVLGTSIQVDNTLRRINAVGSTSSVDIGAGRCVVTGSLRFYYGNNAILTRIRNNTASSYMLRVTDPGGAKAFLVDVPRIKFTGGDPQVPGIDQDRILEAPFQGLRHATLGYTLHMQRFEEYV